jgi:hypothetical protein
MYKINYQEFTLQINILLTKTIFEMKPHQAFLQRLRMNIKRFYIAIRKIRNISQSETGISFKNTLVM